MRQFVSTLAESPVFARDPEAFKIYAEPHADVTTLKEYAA